MTPAARPVLSPLAVWLRQLQVLTMKELRQLYKDRALLIYICYIFTLQIIIAAGEAVVELHHAQLAVFDQDNSSASRDLIYRFRGPYFDLHANVTSAEAGMVLLAQGQAAMLLQIPPDFERTLLRGDARADVRLLVDTSKANLGFLAASYAERIGAQAGGEWSRWQLARRGVDGTRLPEIGYAERIWYNPGLEQAWFGTIGELLTMMTVACILLPAAAMVREKERGTIEQLLVSPLSPVQVMLAKVLAMILVMLAGTSVSLFIIMRLLFQVPVNGSLLLFFSMTALYAFTNAGLGLVAATFARSAAQVGLIVLLMVMPIVLLSGTWTPIESMPAWLQVVMSVSPLRYFIKLAYGILLRGAGLGTLWQAALAMAGLGGMLFALGLWRFRRQFG
jgi:ABC-2 type transport system permease protein